MPVLDDAIAAQLSQYPYGPIQDPVKAALPQSYADRFSGGLRQPLSTALRIPTAEQEAITSDIDPALLAVQRVMGLPQELTQRAAGPMTNALLGPQYGPTAAMVLGNILPVLATAGLGAESDIASALREPAAPTTELPPAGQTTRFGAGPYVDPVTRARPFSAWRYTPAASDPVAETVPLPELAEQSMRYHGTPEPIKMMVPPEMVSSQGNLLGPGFYTTDDMAIAKGYGAGGVTYRVYELNPVKFLNAETTPIPESALKRVGDLLPNTSRFGGQGQAARWNNFYRQRFSGVPAYDVFKQFTDFSPESTMVNKALVQALEEEGYGGLQHMGGKIIPRPGMAAGQELHNVKIYWNPTRDVRIRPMQQYLSQYVRNMPLSGEEMRANPGQYGFRLEKTRVPAPVIGFRKLRTETR